MLLRHIRNFARISRLDTSLLAAMSIFLPMVWSDLGIRKSSEYSIPLLFAAMASFILNDIHDVERDTQNHPDRTLPSGEMSINSAVILYYIILACAVVSLDSFIPYELIFYYVIFLVVVINYNYIVQYFMPYKIIYVAASTAIPVQISQIVINFSGPRWVLPLSLFMFILSREILMDILDRDGDRRNIASVVEEGQLVALSIALQLSSILLISIIAASTVQYIIVFFVLIIGIFSMYLWNSFGNRPRAIEVMKVQLLLCIAMLFR